MSRHVKTQKTRELRSKKDSSYTENSSYWDDVRKHGEGNEDGWREHPQANPDTLAYTESTAPSTPQMLMGEAIAHLQGRQQQVYMLTMRDNKSLAEAAELLGIEKGSAQKYKERAIKFIAGYCQEAIKRGRV